MQNHWKEKAKKILLRKSLQERTTPITIRIFAYQASQVGTVNIDKVGIIVTIIIAVRLVKAFCFQAKRKKRKGPLEKQLSSNPQNILWEIVA